jgi:hypothetical protein
VILFFLLILAVFGSWVLSLADVARCAWTYFFPRHFASAKLHPLTSGCSATFQNGVKTHVFCHQKSTFYQNISSLFWPFLFLMFFHRLENSVTSVGVQDHTFAILSNKYYTLQALWQPKNHSFWSRFQASKTRFYQHDFTKTSFPWMSGWILEAQCWNVWCRCARFRSAQLAAVFLVSHRASFRCMLDQDWNKD